ncbi:ABC transporter ATP-binding protein [Neomoorella thermoacetica]|uniref:ABC transporter ATP-binding protein n=1 Tax=Neomoorella thermoacetica TaxID=1525 RepID=UPI0008FB5DFA|nr:ABC transporter ATP-binding protein [Moorella thermoacetica]APC08998.1 high-affinity branched-chain amino acid transport ATP-binding protein LivF [Moorella thermoacetica]OIQ55054.1 high-affinity branched-chain amino acid transport ATP-binding protein LivF [Moorella thermoacetica]
MLTVKNLSAGYGAILALHEINLEVNQGQIVSIIGANGAGKTTLLNTISGLVRPRQGSILFMGEELPRQPHLVVKRGIVQVPEGRRVFAGLTVRENLLMGGYLRNSQEIARNMEHIYTLFPVLKERAHQYAGTLSGGEQQMLAVGRGLMSNPKVMLFDEPSLGLAPLVVNTIFSIIKRICEEGVTVLLVEQNARKALALCDYAYVLENGRITMAGRGEELLADPRIRKAYLGEQAECKVKGSATAASELNPARG